MSVLAQLGSNLTCCTAWLDLQKAARQIRSSHACLVTGLGRRKAARQAAQTTCCGLHGTCCIKTTQLALCISSLAGPHADPWRWVRRYKTWSEAVTKSATSVAVLYVDAYGYCDRLSQTLARGITKANVATEMVDLMSVDPSGVALCLARTLWSSFQYPQAVQYSAQVMYC